MFIVSPMMQPSLLNPVVAHWYIAPFTAIVASAVWLYQRKIIRTDLLFVGAVILALIPLAAQTALTSSSRMVYYLAFIAAIALAWLWGTHQSRNYSALLYRLFVICAFLWSLLGLAVWLGYTDGEALLIGDWLLSTQLQSKLNGPFTNGNVLGILDFCAAIAAFWLWHGEAGKAKWLWLAAMAILIASATATMSRGAWFTFAIVISLTLFLLYSKSKRKTVIAATTLALSILLGAQINAHQQNEEVHYAFSDRISSTISEGGEGRAVIWASSFEIWKNHPFTGTGYGNMDAEYLSAQSRALKRYDIHFHGFEHTSNAHNLILQLMAEGGIPGGMIALILLYLVSVAVIRNWNRMHSFTWPATMMVFMLCFQSMANITLTRPFPLLLFTLLLGIALSPHARKRATIILNRRVIYAVSFVAAASLLMVGIPHMRNWNYYQEWLTTTDSNRKKELVEPLLADQDLMPYVVGETLGKLLANRSQFGLAKKMMPYIRSALQTKETRPLYQELFYSQALNDDLAAACKTGQFILSQHWPGENGKKYYQAACDGELDSQTLEIRPKDST